MTTDRPFLGVLLMLGFCVLAPLGDAMAKVLGKVLSLQTLILTRFGVQAAILIPLALWLRLSLRPQPGTFGLMWLRSGLHLAGLGLMFAALRELPLADAIAIAFVMPFIMLLLGHFVLGEDVGPHRMAACAVGFVGTLLVIQPNFVAVGWPALYPLGVAVVFALFMLVTRRIAKTIDPVALQAISGVQACILLLPVLLLMPSALSAGVASHLGWLALLGALGTAAHLLMTWSLRFAPSATLAPMQYLEIPFSTLIGWLIFRDLPNGLAALGICITVGAGLYIILREGRLSRRAIVPPQA